MPTNKSTTRRKQTRGKPTSVQPVATNAYIVDGIEGDVARVELPDGTMADYPLTDLPTGVQEGDVVTFASHGTLTAGVIDHEATHARRQQAQDALTALNADAPTGNLEL